MSQDSAKVTKPIADRLLTAEDLSRLLRVPKSWVYEKARQGEIPAVPLLGRYKRFDLKVIEELFFSGPKRSLTIGKNRKGSVL